MDEANGTIASPLPTLSPLDANYFEIDFSNVNFKPNFPFNLVNFDGVFIKNCPNLKAISDVLTKRFFVRFFNRQTSTFILKIDIADFEFINPSEIQQLMEKFNKKIFLISIENSSNEKFQIFWKFQDEKIFWTQIQKEISKFVVNFLASSMRNDGHCRLSADFLSSFQSTENILEVDKLVLRNLNGLNLLMIAAEHGDSNVVNFCLKSGFNVNETVNETKAVDLAWNNQHFEIVLDLLKANSQFPVDFEVSLATAEVKEFVDMTVQLHKLILNNNLSEISKILKHYQNMHHFYSTENISAPAFALMKGKFDIYEFLIANNVYIGPDENVDEIFKTISQSKCKDLKKIHLKYLKNFKENHLIILALNSVVDQDDPSANEKLSHVRKAFKFLDEVDPFISLILQIVAASRDFKIIFDFEYSAIQASALKIHKSQELVREIKIAALDLLNPMKTLDVYGSIARELCIYAFEIVYKHHLKPKLDHNSQFYNIINSCESNRQSEELVDKALNSSTVNNELIALVPQMMIKYFNNPVKMDDCRENFSELFKFCQDFIEPEMKRKLPSIKSSAEQKAQKFKVSNQRQLKLLIALILAIPFTIWWTFILTMPHIDPLYSCGNLTDELRKNVFESTVDFQGVNVIFGDLFGRNSSACEHLSPQEVTRMLKVFNSGKSVDNYTGIYENFTADENLRIAGKVNPKWEVGYKKIMDENINQVIYEEKNQGSQDNIYMKYMNKKFREPALKIHQKVQTRTKFYIERMLKLPNPSSDINSGIPFGFNTINKIKLLLLSDKGGTGKSTYFRNMAWKLKRRFPLKWISYIDLKQHIHVLQDVPKTDANLTTIVDFLSSKILNLTSKVEIEVFGRKFLSNDSIFLWDGVDEVSPMYTDEALRLIEIVSKLTDNKQWISTRPHLEKQIVGKFKIKAFKLEQYSDEDKLEFVTKFMSSEGLKNLNISKVYEKINNFKIRTEKRHNADFFNSYDTTTDPLILQIICESYVKELKLTEKTNLYTVYDNYLNKKFEEVVMDKGEVAKQDFLKVTELGLFKKLHQHHAIAPITKFGITDAFTRAMDLYCKNLEINKSYKNLKDEEVLRFGIVYKQNGLITFEHRTFKEFFIAQYFLTNVWELTDGSPRDEEANLRLQFLFSILATSDTEDKVVADFMSGFIDTYSGDANPPFNEVIKRIMLTDYTHLITALGINFNGINLATKFFKKDHDILNTLWKVNENRTYFHNYFEKDTVKDEIDQIMNILDENFNQEDKNKILSGKHQAANFLRMTWQKRMNTKSAIAFMIAVNFTCDFEKLIKIHEFDEFMKYFETQEFTKDELWEFLIATWSSRAIRTSNDRKVFIAFANKSLSRMELLEISRNWGSGGMLFELS